MWMAAAEEGEHFVWVSSDGAVGAVALNVHGAAQLER